jgi:hypothetical protein
MKESFLKNNRILCMILLSLSSFFICCATEQKSIEPISNFPELNMMKDGEGEKYLISTYQYSGNEIGEIQEISGYRVFFKIKKLDDDSVFYHFYRIEKADSVKDILSIVWKELEGIKEFRTIIDRSNEINSGKKYLGQIPHNNMDSYNIYVSLMDILMYQKYKNIALNQLLNDKDVYEFIPLKNDVEDWAPIISNIRIEDSPTYLYFIGKNEKDENVFFYKNDNTKVNQTISVNVFKMPSKGTTRFLGFIKTDKSGNIVNATLSEYFNMEIWPMFFMKMNMFVRREQNLEKIE